MAHRLKASSATDAGSADSAVGVRFCWDYTYVGQSPEMKQQIVDMAMNASGIRDTARVLHVSPTTVVTEFKKKEPALQPVNHALLAILNPAQIEVEIWRADELAVRRGLSSELDEMWSFVGTSTYGRGSSVWYAVRSAFPKPNG